MTQQLLNEFLWEILKEKEFIHIRSEKIRALITELDSREEFWHLEQSILYTIKVWRLSEERRVAVSADSVKYNEAIFERKELLAKLRKGIASYLHTKDDQICFEMALRILKSGNNIVALQFGVDISKAPILTKPHLVMGEDNKYYEL